MDSENLFWETFRDGVDVQASMSDISIEILGRHLSGRQMRVAFLFHKLLMHLHSILRMIEYHRVELKGEVVFDHFSICALGRVCTDAATMVMYLSEPSLNLDQWNLRRKVLYLHDLCSRKRFFGAVGLGVNDGIIGGDTILASIQSDLRASIISLATSLSRADGAELSNGSKVYVDGLRGAVREAGWEVDQFEFQQTYLSSFVHPYPVSFMRAVEQSIDFFAPSPAQFAAANMALEVSFSASKDVIKRARKFLAEGGDPLAQFFDAEGNQIVDG